MRLVLDQPGITEALTEWARTKFGPGQEVRVEVQGKRQNRRFIAVVDAEKAAA